MLATLWRRVVGHGLMTRVALWPVACSLLIMMMGGAFLWDRTGDVVIEDRKRVFSALANLARQDVEGLLDHVAQDLTLWAAQWAEQRRSDVSDRDDVPLNWASNREDQKRLYELVLYVNRDKRVVFARSPSLPDAELASLAKVPLETLLDLPSNWIEPTLSRGLALAQSPRPIRELNEIQHRPPTPITRSDVPAHYQMIFAVPVRSSADTTDIDGAVVAVASWRAFQEELDRFKTYSTQIGLKSGYAFLVETTTNRTIGHELRDPKGDNFYLKNLVDDFNLPQLAKALRDGPEEPFSYELRGASKFAAVRRITPPTIFRDQLSWGLGLGVNEAEIRQSVSQLKTLFALVGTLAILAVFATTVLIGRHISVSVKELIRVARDAGGAAAQPLEGDDEIAELQHVVNQLAVHHRQSRAFTPLTNPYVVGNPIHHGSMFFGRADDVTWIKDHLQQAGNELILLTGQRRIGKTSLLRHVKRLKSELKLIPFFIDTQSLIPTVADDHSFYRCLLDELQVQFCDAAPDLPEPTLVATDSAQDSIWKLFKYLNNARPDAVPVLLIDELENFEHKFKSKTLTPDVLKFLAALLDSTRTVSCIATGSDRLEKRKAKYWSALLVKSVRRHLGVLSARDALRMVTDPLAGKVTVLAGRTSSDSEAVWLSSLLHPGSLPAHCERDQPQADLQHRSQRSERSHPADSHEPSTNVGLFLDEGRQSAGARVFVAVGLRTTGFCFEGGRSGRYRTCDARAPAPAGGLAESSGQHYRRVDGRRLA